MGYQARTRGACIIIITALLSAEAIGFHAQSVTYIKGVVTQSSKPVRSVWVIISQSGHERGRYLTGDDGKFYVGNLPSGDCEIAVWQGKQQIYSSRVNLPGNNVFNIVITPPKAPMRAKPRR
jgi:hypothetical protein